MASTARGNGVLGGQVKGWSAKSVSRPSVKPTKRTPSITGGRKK